MANVNKRDLANGEVRPKNSQNKDTACRDAQKQKKNKKITVD